jgi:uncharacterized phage protein (TIGR02218 family)
VITTDPVGLAAWLANARFAKIFDAFTLISTIGQTLRFTDADADLQLPAPDGRLFVRGPIIKQRSQIKQSVGLSVDNMSLELGPVAFEQPVMFGVVSLLTAAQAGLLRGATLQLERLVYDENAVYQGRWVEFAGTLAVKSTAGGVIKADVLSELNLLSTPFPRDVYQSQCKNTVFDANCRLVRSAWEVSGSISAVASGDAVRMQFTSALAQASGWFDQGVVQFTSGANAGIKRTVKRFAGGVFSFALPWPRDLAVGNSFVAVPGCARTLDACTNKFANRLHFRGEPFIPQPETVN